MKRFVLAFVAAAMLVGGAVAAYALPNIITGGMCPVHMVPMDKCPQGMMHP